MKRPLPEKSEEEQGQAPLHPYLPLNAGVGRPFAGLNLSTTEDIH